MQACKAADPRAAGHRHTGRGRGDSRHLLGWQPSRLWSTGDKAERVLLPELAGRYQCRRY
jgi:hypothetical protein